MLHKLPAMRYLALSNAIVTYFGETTLKAAMSMVKSAQVTDAEAVEKKSKEELLDNISNALQGVNGLNVPMDAFQKLARLMCPFIEAHGKPLILPHESNMALLDTQIDMMFADHPSDVLPVVYQAIAFNLADFFSAARLPSILKRQTSS